MVVLLLCGGNLVVIVLNGCMWKYFVMDIVVEILKSPEVVLLLVARWEDTGKLNRSEPEQQQRTETVWQGVARLRQPPMADHNINMWHSNHCHCGKHYLASLSWPMSPTYCQYLAYIWSPWPLWVGWLPFAIRLDTRQLLFIYIASVGHPTSRPGWVIWIDFCVKLYHSVLPSMFWMV